MSELATESLLGKGLIKEKFDNQKDDLVRKLTPKGRLTSENLLKDPKYLRAYLKLAKAQFSKYPENLRKILWKQLANQLKNLKEKEKRNLRELESSNANSAKELLWSQSILK